MLIVLIVTSHIDLLQRALTKIKTNHFFAVAITVYPAPKKV